MKLELKQIKNKILHENPLIITYIAGVLFTPLYFMCIHSFFIEEIIERGDPHKGILEVISFPIAFLFFIVNYLFYKISKDKTFSKTYLFFTIFFTFLIFINVFFSGKGIQY